MRAGEAAVCGGSVLHRRFAPARHEFRYPVSYVWLDPDDPNALCAAHPLWSTVWPAPARFRRRDYGVEPVGSISDGVRDEVESLIGRRPFGDVRMLTQVRRWGWLFNPITVYVVWDADPDVPIAAVLEVTNTPWKERHRAPILWSAPDADGWFTSSVDKQLHVSPFLDEDCRYDLRLRAVGDGIEFELDVIRELDPRPILHTSLVLRRALATRQVLGRSLWTSFAPTHRVSLGIHLQAARLWLKRVPFVAHPSKRSTGTEATMTATTTTTTTTTRTMTTPTPTTPTTTTPTTPTSTTSSQTGGELAASRRDADVRADRLLAHAGLSAPATITARVTAAMSARVMHALLARLSSDQLSVHERVPGRPPADHRFGPGGELSASVTVVDPRAYSAVLTDGSIGFGRGFIEGWWTSSDPVAVVQVVIRNMTTIDRLRNRWRSVTGGLTDRLRHALPHDSRQRNRDDISAHYDIGNAFFELFLDETMTYSSAVFPTPGTSLADGSRHKYDILLDKLGVDVDDRVLEIGTGWGGMAIRAAGRGADVTTTTISSEQLRAAGKRVAEAGYTDRVTLLDSDWRDLSGRFDQVVSIEMIEAVDWRDYDAYFSTIERCLTPTGVAAIQAITLPDDRWERAKNTEDFIRRFVFPNGFLPSVRAIRASVDRATEMRVVDVEDLTEHYAETLRRWRARFDDRLDEVAGLGLDERFQRLWRFYLAYCEAGFRERHCTLHQVVIAGRDRAAEPSAADH
ncbi:MAG: DUF1365 family protein [Ilumatobacteraceae bacterium]